MSEQNQNQEEVSRLAKIEESMKDLSVIELVSKKETLKKELDKQMQSIGSVDLAVSLKTIQELDKAIKELTRMRPTSKGERKKALEMSKKIIALLANLSSVEKLLSDKQKTVRALEKISELSEIIPIIEKLYQSKDF